MSLKKFFSYFISWPICIGTTLGFPILFYWLALLQDGLDTFLTGVGLVPIWYLLGLAVTTLFCIKFAKTFGYTRKTEYRFIAINLATGIALAVLVWTALSVGARRELAIANREVIEQKQLFSVDDIQVRELGKDQNDFFNRVQISYTVNWQGTKEIDADVFFSLNQNEESSDQYGLGMLAVSDEFRRWNTFTPGKWQCEVQLKSNAYNPEYVEFFQEQIENSSHFQLLLTARSRASMEYRFKQPELEFLVDRQVPNSLDVKKLKLELEKWPIDRASQASKDDYPDQKVLDQQKNPCVKMN